MEEGFDHNQHRGYYNNWRKAYYLSQAYFLPKQSIQHTNEINESDYYYETTFTRKRLQPMLITDTNLPTLLAASLEQAHILVNADTFYVKDIRDRKDTPYNTIVFQINEPPLVSTEDSKTIMERYFNQKPLDYKFVQYIGKTVGIHQKCPFISGLEIFVPEKGTAKEPASWYGLHHICGEEEHKKGNYMQVQFQNHHELQLMISPHSYREQIERAGVLKLLQDKMVAQLMRLSPYTSELQYTTVLNPVEKYLSTHSIQYNYYPLKKILIYMAMHQVNEIIEEIFGEDNPYIVEVKKAFLKDLKNEPPTES
ncbi:competence protein ComK [Desemzia sp. FAM 23990]|uniref:competence protein ComK n=1 Tax=Desemzia sp. FAM 23990 TaxID=3259520 RepID=UPI00388A7D55